MRRLIIEINAADFTRLSGEQSIEKLESLEVLNFLREDLDEFVTICRVGFKNPSTTFDEVFKGPWLEAQVLDHDKDGKYTAIFKGNPRQDPTLREFLAMGGFLSTPLEINGGKIRVTFLGSPKQVRALLAKTRKSGIRHKVVQLMDASLSPKSPLSHLTEKQRRVIILAFELGYYDVPRRIKTEELAKKLNIRGSTLAMHRVKAEQRLLAQILAES